MVFPRRGSHFLAFYGAGGRPWDWLVGVNFRCRKCGIPYAGLTLSSALWGWREDLGWACWRQLSMSKVWYSLCETHHFWLSMGLEGGLVMGLLDQTFDVESVVFLMRDLHFLGFYGFGGRICYGSV